MLTYSWDDVFTTEDSSKNEGDIDVMICRKDHEAHDRRLHASGVRDGFTEVSSRLLRPTDVPPGSSHEKIFFSGFKEGLMEQCVRGQQVSQGTASPRSK